MWAEIDKPNQTGETPLFAACKAGRAGAVAALLKWGADPMLSSKKGETPAAAARASGDEAIRRFKEGDEIVKFPLSDSELSVIKEEYFAVKACVEEIKKSPNINIKEEINKCVEKNDKPRLIALLIAPEKIKGRIAQMNDVVIVDEVNNLFLDAAMNSARLSLP